MGADPKPIPIPSKVDARIRRGRARTRKGQNRRKMYYEFFRGNQYCWLNPAGALLYDATTNGVGGKPRHRVRKTNNRIRPIVEAKVSSTTKTVPSYQINPSTTGDPKRVSAADLAQKVALYGYTKWNVRRATIDTVTHALVAESGFAWPYFDTSIGPFVDDGEGGTVGLGEINIRVFSRNEVHWEPGVDFEDSRWCAVEQARLVDDVYQMDGYLGGKLDPDAGLDSPDTKKNKEVKELVLVTDYLERPSRQFPSGRWLTFASGRVIAGVGVAEDGTPSFRPYPLVDALGRVCDEPVLHKLSYLRDPDSDEDLSLVADMLDPQRSLNDVESKIAEWKNRTLNPRILAPIGSMLTEPDDEPGGIDYYRPVGGQVPQWEQPPQPPQFLVQMAENIKQDIQYIGAADEVPQQLSSSPSIQAFIEQQQERWQQFLGNLDDWDCALMRHCLYLVANHYTEGRLISFRGEFGWDSVDDFKGADMLGETDIRILPGSRTALTREQAKSDIQMLAQMFPGQMTMEQALSAMQSGDAANSLLNGYRYDIAQAEETIKKIRGLGKAFFEVPWRYEFISTPAVAPSPQNPLGSQASYQQIPVPGWYPRKQANPGIQKSVIANYMKTPDFANQPMAAQEGLSIYYDALELIEQQGIQGAAQMMEGQAAQLGMQNAAAPQIQPAPPSQPSLQPGVRPS